MKKFNGNVMVGSIVAAGFIWLGVESTVLKDNSHDSFDKARDNEYIDISIFNKDYTNQSGTNFYHEFKKEEEESRLIAIHKKRVKQLDIDIQVEKDRLRKIEEEKKRKIKEAKRLRELEKKQVVISRGESNIVESNWITFEATYYSALCKTCDGKGITATGMNVRNTITYNGYRIIATDPKIIPMWSLVEIVTPHESFTAIAADKGGDIKNNRIDILVKNDKIAYSLGRHDVKIKILKYGK